MRRLVPTLLAVCSIIPAACVSLAPRSQTASTNASAIEGVPARRWADNSCAAGALSEVLNSLGDPVTEERLSESLTKGRRGGVVTVDLLLTARRRGFDAQLVRGDVELVERELQQKHPLILMLRVLDTRGTRDDLFHYVVLSGIDQERGLVCLHYGDGRRRWVSLKPLEPAWSAGGYATFLIGPRRKRTATEDDLKRAVLLEEAGRPAEAIALYRYYLESHPESALGWTNLGNAQARLNENQSAEVAYRNALFLDKDDSDTLNNLAWMLLGQKRLDEAEVLARRAASLNQHDRFAPLDTLARVLVARGKCSEAAPIFSEAAGAISNSEMKVRASGEYALLQRDCK